MAESGSFPIPKFYFSVDLFGNSEISFKEVTGLSQEYEMMEYREGKDMGFYTKKRLGMTKSSPVTLKKGIHSLDPHLSNIINDAGPLEGGNYDFWADGEPGTVIIQLKNEKGSTIVTWTLTECIPTKMTFSDLASDSSEIAIEEMELNYAKMEFTYS
jgi:phage tail-like protein